MNRKLDDLENVSVPANFQERLISIVMPAYNCQKYIRQAVESVISQSYEKWELIIIDDCSSDDTWLIMQELASNDNRIRIFQNKYNIGVGKTRNRGTELAMSEWIAFLDSDDFWTEYKLEKQIKLLSFEVNAKLLYTGSAFITEDGDLMEYTLCVPEKIKKRQLLKQNLVSCSSVLVSKKCLLKYPMSGNPNIHEDFAVWLRILSEEQYAYGINEPLLVYRRSKDSKSGNKIKAAKMNWNTYKEVGIGLFKRIYYMTWYAIKGILKYRNLQK